MEKKSKKGIIIGITSLLLVTLVLLGLTYAYYRTRIIGNNSNEPSISAVSKYLAVEYSDGTAVMNMTGKIEPGFNYTKTFSVENTGSEEVLYAVYLEDIVNEYTRTEDWEFEVTCSPNCSGTDGVVEFPQLSEMIVENKIASGVTQNYNITINYLESDEDQSIDMGATLEGKFQIYSLEDVVDIEGTITSYEDGDYVQINSIEKKSQIVNGKYRLPAVEVGNHILKVMKKDGTLKGTTNLIIEKGIKGINGSKVTINNDSQTVLLNIIDITTDLDIEIIKIKEKSYSWEDAPSGSLLYALKNNQPSGTETTIPGQELSTINEARILTIEDDYGTSYVYRGNVLNNYVNYSGMCWRIVRVQGDGIIKLVLADEHGECDADTYSTTNTSTAFINDASRYKYSNLFSAEETIYDASEFIYAKSNIVIELAKWMNKEKIGTDGTVLRGHNLDTSKLATTEWCNDTSILSEDEIIPEVSYGGLVRTDENMPTLKCDMTGLNNSKALKYESNIGLLTVDELEFAGADGLLSSTMYLYTNAQHIRYWTMSPLIFNSEYGVSHYYVVSNEEIIAPTSDDTIAIRPVIALMSSVAIEDGGNGTQSNPYVIG